MNKPHRVVQDHLPAPGGRVIPQDVTSTVIATNFKIPVVGPEPHIGDLDDLDRYAAEREPSRRRLAGWADRTLNSYGEFELLPHNNSPSPQSQQPYTTELVDAIQTSCVSSEEPRRR